MTNRGKQRTLFGYHITAYDPGHVQAQPGITKYGIIVDKELWRRRELPANVVYM